MDLSPKYFAVEVHNIENCFAFIFPLGDFPASYYDEKCNRFGHKYCKDNFRAQNTAFVIN